MKNKNNQQPVKVRDFNAVTSTRPENKKAEMKSMKKTGTIASGAPGNRSF